jgi:hypothetical protein
VAIKKYEKGELGHRYQFLAPRRCAHSSSEWRDAKFSWLYYCTVTLLLLRNLA